MDVWVCYCFIVFVLMFGGGCNVVCGIVWLCLFKWLVDVLGLVFWFVGECLGDVVGRCDVV